MNIDALGIDFHTPRYEHRSTMVSSAAGSEANSMRPDRKSAERAVRTLAAVQNASCCIAHDAMDRRERQARGVFDAL
jgi:hypothetical protein